MYAKCMQGFCGRRRPLNQPTSEPKVLTLAASGNERELPLFHNSLIIVRFAFRHNVQEIPRSENNVTV